MPLLSILEFLRWPGFSPVGLAQRWDSHKPYAYSPVVIPQSVVISAYAVVSCC